MTQVSRFFHNFRKAMLKPFGAINKRIHEATGKAEPGGAVPNPPAGDRGSATFRQTGRSPEDRSGFPVKHLGDKR
jgi:hypothetical protein